MADPIFPSMLARLLFLMLQAPYWLIAWGCSSPVGSKMGAFCPTSFAKHGVSAILDDALADAMAAANITINADQTIIRNPFITPTKELVVSIVSNHPCEPPGDVKHLNGSRCPSSTSPFFDPSVDVEHPNWSYCPTPTSSAEEWLVKGEEDPPTGWMDIKRLIRDMGGKIARPRHGEIVWNRQFRVVLDSHMSKCAVDDHLDRVCGLLTLGNTKGYVVSWPGVGGQAEDKCEAGYLYYEGAFDDDVIIAISQMEGVGHVEHLYKKWER